MPNVTIYTKPGCPYCAAAKEHYRSQNIPIKEIDVSVVKGAKEEVIRLAGGQSIVPVIVEDGKVIVGFGGG
ncbi:MAG: Uxx-star family glutaredoxin-like (seleno)protein [candidate division Zixibacteria bacterium]|nr:Uxx-star family glutaredoxin-like (seleno)protein [candidate division Zixibacteria bacterium]